MTTDNSDNIRQLPVAKKNRIVAQSNERSPTDPQECCDWANARLAISEPGGDRAWVVTGDPAKPIALVRR